RRRERRRGPHSLWLFACRNDLPLAGDLLFASDVVYLRRGAHPARREDFLLLAVTGQVLIRPVGLLRHVRLLFGSTRLGRRGVCYGWASPVRNSLSLSMSKPCNPAPLWSSSGVMYTHDSSLYCS